MTLTFVNVNSNLILGENDIDKILKRTCSSYQNVIIYDITISKATSEWWTRSLGVVQLTFHVYYDRLSILQIDQIGKI